MMQLIIAGCVALALVASIWKFGDTMADSREADVRAAYAKDEKAQRERLEAHEADLRAWALTLSKNYLAFGGNQRTFFDGVKNGLVQEIASNPALRISCLNPDGLSRFNGAAAAGSGGAGAAAGARDGALPGRPPAPSR
ncbi:MAG TPA: hypothetical protein VFP29_12480 [Methyloceanibacter sp.]|nr:hypothetical protein [Methyloceanibacter sp.]